MHNKAMKISSLFLPLWLAFLAFTTSDFANAKASLEQCRSQSENAVKKCDDDAAKRFWACAKQSKAVSDLSGVDIRKNAGNMWQVAAGCGHQYDAGIEKCEKVQKECEAYCKSAEADPEVAELAAKYKEQCLSKIDKQKKKLAEAKKETDTGKTGAEKTGDASGQQPNEGQQQPQQGQQQPQQGGQQGGQPPQQPQQDQKPQETKTAEKSKLPGEDCTGENANSERCKSGKFVSTADLCAGSGAEQNPKCKEYLSAVCKDPRNAGDPRCTGPGGIKVASFCAGGSNSQCPSCRGMTTSSFQAMSSSDLKAMCTGGCASDPQFGPNLADRCRSVIGGASTQSFQPASAGGGSASSGGSAGGGLSGGAAPSLEDELPDSEGKREAYSIGDLTTGGGGGGGSTTNANSFWGSSSNEDSSSRAAGRGTASQGNSTGSYQTASATDIAQVQGPSVFRILDRVIRARCEAGRLNNCGPRK